MSVNVIMPKLGESITEGTILEWKKQVGDLIERDETLLEISTDKVDSEVPSPAKGKVIEILFKVNDVVPVGEIIARIGDNSDEVINTSEKNVIVNEEVLENPTQNIIDETNDNSKTKEENKMSSKFYSPLVKSIAKKEDIRLSELDSINGSGLNGRVNKQDVLDYLDSKNNINQDNDIDNETIKINEYELVNKVEPMGHVRKMISKHMKASRDTSVHVYSTSEVDVTDIVQYRNKFKSSFKDKYNTPLTYTPFIIDAVIKAVHEYPLMNACLENENIKYNQNINIGVAVALPDDNLIVPVIKRSEELNFLGLARSTNDLANRARAGKLSPQEAQGSTFTVTNPGIFGSLFGMGIINQPNVGLLSVGSIHKRPVVKETKYGDLIVSRSMMYLTLAYDHRIIDGAYGTKFLSKVKYLLENFNLDDIKI
tara:strand:+ start:2621 stop:3898 length:1278 start_codon:yes stop_codon:yes gene_type:complete